MNAYVFAAMPQTLNALQAIVGQTAEAIVTDEAVTILTAEKVIVVEAEAEDFETNFECYRLTARESNERPFKKTLKLGKIARVELLTSEEWIEPAVGIQPPGFIGKVQAYQHGGYPGAAPNHALAKCLVDDAVLIVGTHRELFVRCDVMAFQVRALTGGDEIAEHVAERQSRTLAAG